MTRAEIEHLSAHFTLAELTTTSTGLANEPDEEQVRSMVVLCSTVLEPIRVAVGPLRVTSGFRSSAVNRRIGGARGSQHLRGEAADVQPTTTALDYAWAEVVSAVARGLPIDQAIVYQRARGAGWLHLSCAIGRDPRRQLLVQPSGRPGTYVPLDVWTGPVVL